MIVRSERPHRPRRGHSTTGTSAWMGLSKTGETVDAPQCDGGEARWRRRGESRFDTYAFRRFAYPQQNGCGPHIIRALTWWAGIGARCTVAANDTNRATRNQADSSDLAAGAGVASITQLNNASGSSTSETRKPPGAGGAGSVAPSATAMKPTTARQHGTGGAAVSPNSGGTMACLRQKQRSPRRIEGFGCGGSGPNSLAPWCFAPCNPQRRQCNRCQRCARDRERKKISPNSGARGATQSPDTGTTPIRSRRGAVGEARIIPSSAPGWISSPHRLEPSRLAHARGTFGFSGFIRF